MDWRVYPKMCSSTLKPSTITQTAQTTGVDVIAKENVFVCANQPPSLAVALPARKNDARVKLVDIVHAGPIHVYDGCLLALLRRHNPDVVFVAAR